MLGSFVFDQLNPGGAFHEKLSSDVTSMSVACGRNCFNASCTASAFALARVDIWLMTVMNACHRIMVRGVDI